ncbi:MAG: hypothetical protein U1G07_23145 [Verrucomicrobiota bacterium]
MASLLAAAGAIWWYFHWRTAPWHPALTAREAATRVLAEYLAGQYPQASALVVGNPFTQRSGQSAEIYAFEQASIRGLVQGFGSPAKVRVVFPELRRAFLEQPGSVFIDPKTTTPLSYLVADDAFDRLVATNANATLVVSLIGVPVQIRDSALWRDHPHQRLALLLPDWRLVGDRESVRTAFKSGKMVAAVMQRPGAPAIDQTRSRDYREAFQRRFLLVTRENIDELLSTYPQLF